MLLQSRARTRYLSLLMVMVLAGAAFLLTQPSPAVATEPAPGVHQGNLVPESPELPTGRILNGRVYAGDRVGDHLVFGGTFTQIELADGSTVDQRYVAAFDLETGAFEPDFRPQLDGHVFDIQAGDLPGTVFIGGRFVTIDGQPAKRIAKLRLADGSAVPGWDSQVSGTVKTMEVRGENLYVGGGFSLVNGVTRRNLARISTITGDLDTSFDIPVTGDRQDGRRADGLFYNGSGPVVRDLAVTPDGSRLAITHRADLVDGQRRWGVAMVDLGATPTVSGWDMSWLWPSSDFVGVVEAEMSPDGSLLAFTNFIGNFPPIHDTVIGVPVAGNGTMQPLWVTQAFDSVYGIAISDSAVYVGGHFCWIEGPHEESGPLSWPGNSGNGYSCERTGGGVFPNTVYRGQVAALDPATGHALDWDPGSNSGNGVRFLRVIDRGLLLGHDGSRVNDRRTGRGAFLDLGNAYDTTTVPEMCTVTEVDGTVTVEWLKDAANRWVVRRDGTWVGSVSGDPEPVTDTPGAGTHSYTLESRFGSTSETIDCGVVTVDAPDLPEPACSVTLNGTTATIEWVDDGATRWTIYRDGSWAQTVQGGDGLAFSEDPGTGTHSYTMKSVLPGPDPITDCGAVTVDPPDVPEPACSVTLNGTTATIEWVDDGANRWTVYRDGSWRQTVQAGDGVTFSEDPGTGTHNYTVKSVLPGPDPITDCGEVTVG